MSEAAAGSNIFLRSQVETVVSVHSSALVVSLPPNGGVTGEASGQKFGGRDARVHDTVFVIKGKQKRTPSRPLKKLQSVHLVNND